MSVFLNSSIRSVLTFTEPSEEDLGLYTVEMSDNANLSSSYDFTAEGKLKPLAEMCESSKRQQSRRFILGNCLVQFIFVRSSKYFSIAKNEGLCIKMAVVPKQLMKYFCYNLSFKAEHIHFIKIMMAFFLNPLW